MASTTAARRWLAVLVGSVAVAAAGLLVWAAGQVSFSDPLAFPIVMTLLVTGGGVGTVVMRSRSQHLWTTTAPAVLAAVVVLPPGWAVLSVAVGFALAKAIRRQMPRKAVFNTGKEVLATVAAVAAASAVGLVPAAVADQPISTAWGSYLLGLAAAAIAYAAVDELLPPVAIGLATGTRWVQVAGRDLDIRTVTRAVDVALAAAAVALAVVDLRLLVLVPAALLVAYLGFAYRLRLREERRAWQQFSTVSDTLAAASGTGELSHVLRTALTGAAELFPDAEVEIEATDWAVRGTRLGVAYDGPADDAPPAGPAAGEVALATPDGTPIGFLRLRFPTGPARLADREPLLVSTLAPHLATAIANTTAYAEAVRLASRNAHDATHDPLTDLANRRHLHQHLVDRLAARPPGHVAVMLIDLDHFKEINDTIGHPAGDRVLVEVAHRLRTAAARDALVARLGGDEFAVVFHERAPAAATLHAEQILADLRSEPMDLDGVPISLDASGGLAIATDHTGAGELLRRADVALYQAKGLTEQPVRLAVNQRARAAHPVTFLPSRAQVPRTDRLALKFQPIVDLATGQVVGAEAIPSWQPASSQHPEHRGVDPEPIPPARLLGILTRSGPTALRRFVDRMLDDAVKAAQQWHRAGFTLAIAINLTPRSIARPDFPTAVRAKLYHHGLQPQSLTIELTHTTTGHSPPFERNLAGLREAGIRVALDGFGTGNSTLAAIYRLPIDAVKIDRGFVADLLEAPKAAAVIGSIVELGRRFDLAVIAEGVEQHSQRQTLWEIGCAYGQGRLLGNPQTSGDLLATIQRGFDHQPGLLCPSLHADATIIRMPTKPAKGR